MGIKPLAADRPRRDQPRISISELAASPGRWLDACRRSGRPIVITRRGADTAILSSIEAADACPRPEDEVDAAETREECDPRTDAAAWGQWERLTAEEREALIAALHAAGTNRTAGDDDPALRTGWGMLAAER